MAVLATAGCTTLWAGNGPRRTSVCAEHAALPIIAVAFEQRMRSPTSHTDPGGGNTEESRTNRRSEALEADESSEAAALLLIYHATCARAYSRAGRAHSQQSVGCKATKPAARPGLLSR
jgi:hypothetical protein